MSEELSDGAPTGGETMLSGCNDRSKLALWLDLMSYVLILLAFACFPLYLTYNSRWRPWPFDDVLKTALPCFALFASVIVDVVKKSTDQRSK